VQISSPWGWGHIREEDAESEALAVLDSLRPVTAKTLAGRMSTVGRT
jgi:hypothetical protein